ncbi:MAG TPA: GNAT family N-acetyltransferase [Solirubrobacteraceae bacterium]|nr:GNAT family N-acetyltransferase [Solirubrobacteraceae bacterium]
MPDSMPDGVSIEELPTDRLDELAPLWNSLREHHLTVAPSWLPPAYDPEESWRHRERQYREWLADPDSFVLVARRDHGLVGYAMVHLRDGSPTWPTAERAGELETLSVLPVERGSGIGRALLDSASQRLHALGASEISLHLLVGNDDAGRFYEREGFSPYATWLTKSLPASDVRGT